MNQDGQPVEYLKPCRFKSRLPGRGHCPRVARRFGQGALGETNLSIPDGPQDHHLRSEGREEGDTKVVDQALWQEQAVFERKIVEFDARLKLQRAMGWMTFAMVPGSVIATVVYPPAAIAMIPLNGLAAWNWRRMLKRDSGEIEVVTKRPERSE